MNWIPSLFRRRKLYDDLSEEMRLHIEERADQLKGEGMSPEEAERQARIAFGNPTVIEERSREVWQWPTLESIGADVRLACGSSAFSRIHVRRDCDLGTGHRRQRGGVQRYERVSAAPAACAAARQPLPAPT